MKATISNLFYIKRAKANSKGQVPIFQRVTVSGQRIERSTTKYIEPAAWSSEANKVRGKSEEARLINSHLDRLKLKVAQAETDLLMVRLSVNYSNMKMKLIGNDAKQRMLIPIFKEHNSRMQALVPNQYAQGTVVRYQTSLVHTEEFLKWKFGTRDIDVAEIDYSFICDYEFYLRSERHCANNTTVKYIKNFQKIINICLDNEWLEKDPFKKYKVKLKEVKRDFLSQQELENIYSKTFATPRLALVRDIFVFSCFTGLAYIDVKQLTTANISIGIDGSRWIFTQREKTENPSHIPLLEIPEQILSKYADHPRCANGECILPILSNQRMNSYVKEIADVCQISKDLTFHVARHTFATTVTLTNGVPLESVGKMLGHKSIRSTQHYAKILDKKVSEDMQQLKHKFSNLSTSSLKISNAPNLYE